MAAIGLSDGPERDENEKSHEQHTGEVGEQDGDRQEVVCASITTVLLRKPQAGSRGQRERGGGTELMSPTLPISRAIGMTASVTSANANLTAAVRLPHTHSSSRRGARDTRRGDGYTARAQKVFTAYSW